MTGFIEEILPELGIGGGSLSHIQAMAKTVNPDAMEAMADVFDKGNTVLGQSHGELEGAVDNVVTGWKGDAARAASTKVLGTSATSRGVADNSTSAAAGLREYASNVRGLQSQIAAVQPVDTSFSTAMHNAGGPAAVILNPGGIATNMAAAQVQSAQHQAKAANYLQQMNSSGESFASTQPQTFQPMPNRGQVDNLPATLSSAPPPASAAGGPARSWRSYAATESRNVIGLGKAAQGASPAPATAAPPPASSGKVRCE